jgi:hypothetical protein
MNGLLMIFEDSKENPPPAMNRNKTSFRETLSLKALLIITVKIAAIIVINIISGDVS